MTMCRGHIIYDKVVIESYFYLNDYLTYTFDTLVMHSAQQCDLFNIPIWHIHLY